MENGEGPVLLKQLPDCLTVVEAAAVLRIGRASAYDAIHRGELTAVKIGRRLLVPRAVIERLLSGA
jgi:excisionase family DNA binding protein